jgi:hypothetical protein
MTNSTLKIGLKCKACDKPLPKDNIDPELCAECFGIVMDANKDLIDTLPSVDFEEVEL